MVTDIRYYTVLRKWKKEGIILNLQEYILFEEILKRRKRNNITIIQALLEVMDADYSDFEKEMKWWNSK